MNYYNENDPHAAQWLRNLIASGEIPSGIVDTRSIEDVLPNDLKDFTQCHFFAGIGGWPLALRLAGWPDDQPVWTASCPCQPFSQAGEGRGTADERHLWPAFHWLAEQQKRRPAAIFGEQVASAAGRQWLAGIRSDLEAMDYAVGSADLCAAGVGAPQIRQRLFWVAHSHSHGRESPPACQCTTGQCNVESCRRLGDTAASRQLQGRAFRSEAEREGHRFSDTGHLDCGLCNASGAGLPNTQQQRLREPGRQDERRTAAEHGPVPGSWGNNWIACADGKARRIEPGLSPLVDGLPRDLGVLLAGLSNTHLKAIRSNRVVQLKGYGNAIVPALAAEFINAFRRTAIVLPETQG